MSSHTPSIAYFSAEYAIAEDMPIYAGGLGVLAADTILEAAKQNRDFTAVGLVYHLAFTGDDPDQRPMTQRLHSNGFEVIKDEAGHPVHAKVMIAKRPVVMQAWMRVWGRTRLILLDTNLSENVPEDRAICDRLYAADPNLQLAQEVCLGFGGVQILEKIEITPDVYHLNEGHTAMAGLAVVARARQQTGHSFEEAVAQARPKLVGTKHTILPGAGILLDWDSVTHQLEPLLKTFGINIEELKPIATQREGDFSGTKLMLSLTRLANGVSEIHVAAELHDHPQSRLITITNGISSERWLAENWAGSPLVLSDGDLWTRHCENRQALFEMILAQTGHKLDPKLLTVVWARRMAVYKRPELLVSDLDRLMKLVRDPQAPIQFVMAGKANPADGPGVELMNQVIAVASRPELTHRFAYLPQYNPVTAKLLVRGADLWLNTPIRGYEACGTSGMKAGINGALQLSTLDGWIDEVRIQDIGWSLPDNEPAEAIYHTLEREIAPLFYRRDANDLPLDWIKKMRAAIELTMKQFTAERMLNDYYAKLYR